ncbi:methyltransferase family protein [Sulfuriflexus mobilis]|uniref:methyltransferase family protein n=1 Tax=Sulfuriflexus mobilis TaxID=1811807 RepID=UPI000F841436|nr:isoprenylcysteine carboxylmethyltransferase family protein [Sulfuriflexus mobilis]
MQKDSAHKSIWQTTDAMILITLFISVILDKFVINIEIASIPTSLRLVVGILFVFVGLLIITLAKKEFYKEKQPSGPGKPTKKMVNSGVFKYSRNPLYLGVIITIIGLGFSFHNYWLVVLVLPLSIVIHYALIIPEEQYLVDVFGNSYKEYLKNVRRWL